MTEVKSWRDLVKPCWFYYNHGDGNPTGGNLHVVLDNGNWERRHVEWCAEEAKKEGDKLGEELAALLLTASDTQRRKLTDNYHLYRWGAAEPETP